MILLLVTAEVKALDGCEDFDLVRLYSWEEYGTKFSIGDTRSSARDLKRKGVRFPLEWGARMHSKAERTLQSVVSNLDVYTGDIQLHFMVCVLAICCQVAGLTLRSPSAWSGSKKYRLACPETAGFANSWEFVGCWMQSLHLLRAGIGSLPVLQPSR
jgi:hypothetical protein